MKKILILVLFFFPVFLFSQDNPNLVPFKKGDLWGFAEKDGTLKINPQYDKVDFFGRGRAKVWKNKNQGFINPQGENLVELIYQKTDFLYLGDQLFSAKKGKKWGVVNSKKKTLLKFKFDKIEFLGVPFLRVKQNGLFGVYELVDGKFRKYASPKYSKIEKHDYAEKYLFKGETKNGQIDYIDKNGKIVKSISSKKTAGQENSSTEMEEMEMEVAEESAPPPDNRNKYPQFQPFKNKGKSGMVIQRKSNNLNTYGQILTDTILGDFQEIITKHSFSDAYVVKQNGKWGAINLAGQILIPSEYDSIDVKTMKFQGRGGQTFIVQKDGKWGVIGNANKFRKIGAPNEIRIPFEYDAIRRNVNHTFYIVAKNEKYGVVNPKNFKLIVKPLYPKIKDTFRRINDFAIFFITLENGDEVYVGENGVEFFSK
ncbi:MAG: WG repeat-containing protein [Saprospiraceae bacterium]